MYFALCSPIYNFVSMFSIYLLFCNNNRATQQKILDDNQEWQTFHSGSFIWLLDIFVITRKGPNGPVRQTYLYYIYKTATTSISSCIKGHFLLALFSQLTTILRIYCFNTKCMLYVCVLGSTNGSVDTDRVYCYLLIFEYISFYVYVILLNNGMNSSLHL